MDLDFYVRVRTCKKRVTGKQPLGLKAHNVIVTSHDDVNILMRSCYADVSAAFFNTNYFRSQKHVTLLLLFFFFCWEGVLGVK